MGYTKKILEFLKKIDFKNKTIIELGSQDIDVEIDYLDKYINSLGGQAINLHPYITKNRSRLSTKYLYESLYAKRYDCIDIDAEHNSFCFDLNQDIQKKYSFDTTYDIVTNFGTSEHVFNQYICFKNIHNMCKLDGLMIHSLPIQGSFNHAFFNYHPTFFEHLALANDYTILYMGFKKMDYYKTQDSESITVVFKKNSDKKFEAPIQKTINQPKRTIDKFELDNLKQRFEKVTEIDLNSIKNIAIFGTGIAGIQAYNFAKKMKKNIVCFIDDFKSGNFKNTDIEIVNFDTFVAKYQKNVDLILLGNKQKGNFEKRENINVKVIELSSLIVEKNSLADNDV